MTAQNRLLAAAIGVVVVGFAIGAWIALATRTTTTRTAQTTQSTRAAATAQPRAVPAGMTPATPVPAPTLRPTPAAAPRLRPTPIPTPTPIPVSPQAVATSAAVPAHGAWEIDETNTPVGAIRWVGVANVSGNTIAFDVHKASVAGRAAVPCERETHLRAALSLRVFPQTAPFREVNCQGETSTGEVRVASFSSATGAFSGSFWEDGAKVGDFTAQRL